MAPSSPSTGARSRPSAPRARSLTSGTPARLTLTAATSRRYWHPAGSRCGSCRRNRARCTTSPPPAATPCPCCTPSPQPGCPPSPTLATTAPASISRSGNRPAGGNSISAPAPATPCCARCAAWANADSPCSPARWRTLQHITASPSKIGDIARAALALTHFEHGYIK